MLLTVRAGAGSHHQGPGPRPGRDGVDPAPPPRRGAAAQAGALGSGAGALLDVSDLRVRYSVGERGTVTAVDGVSFSLQEGGRLGVVGESGSGKSSLARSLLRLLPEGAITGSIRFEGEELLPLPEHRLRDIRWARIALCAQGTGSAFSPVHRMGTQMGDPLRAHLRLGTVEVTRRLCEAAELVRLPVALLGRYPHQLSGGEKQRAMLAMTLAGRPRLLIADEPTSGLDPVIAAEVLHDLVALQSELRFALLICSHDLVEVARSTERTAVMYAGRLVEVAQSQALLDEPRHPYSCGLVASHPGVNIARDLRGIGGLPPDPLSPPSGCRFHPRCTQTVGVCAEQDPPLTARNGRLVACHLGGRQTVLQAEAIAYRYPGSAVRAVDGVDLSLRHGEVLAVVGETGSGKTTMARLLVGLLPPDAGSIWFGGERIDRRVPDHVRTGSGGLQMIFQDPYAALSPRLTVLESVREPLDVRHAEVRSRRDELAIAALRLVRLPVTEPFLRSRSDQLSGGQLQRVGIARALVLEPRVLVADEPVSMLDGSEQANLLNLLKELQVSRGLAMVLISHDMAAACRLADRVTVMRAGRIVEEGSSEAVSLHPKHPYSRRLFAAARSAPPPSFRRGGPSP